MGFKRSDQHGLRFIGSSAYNIDECVGVHGVRIDQAGFMKHDFRTFRPAVAVAVRRCSWGPL